MLFVLPKKVLHPTIKSDRIRRVRFPEFVIHLNFFWRLPEKLKVTPVGIKGSVFSSYFSYHPQSAKVPNARRMSPHIRFDVETYSAAAPNLRDCEGTHVQFLIIAHRILVILLLHILQECFDLRFDRGAVQRLSHATLLLCVERCQCRLMCFLRFLSGFGSWGLASLIDRRVYFVSQLAECCGYLLIFFFSRHRCEGGARRPKIVTQRQMRGECVAILIWSGACRRVKPLSSHMIPGEASPGAVLQNRRGTVSKGQATVIARRKRRPPSRRRKGVAP